MGLPAGYVQYQSTVQSAADTYGVPVSILGGLIQQESGWNVAVPVGSAGEIGFGQIKPSTAGDLGINPYDPVDNINGAAKYLSQQYQKFGNWSDALGAYNQGAGGYQGDGHDKGVAYAQSVLNKAKAFGDVPSDAGGNSNSQASTASATNSTGSSSLGSIASTLSNVGQIFTGDFWKSAGLYVLAGVVIVILIGGGTLTIIRPNAPGKA